MKFMSFTLILPFLLLDLYGYQPTPNLQNTIQNKTTGLDVVVIVDQSGSMTGQGSKAKNDPHGIRNGMVLNILTTLVMHGSANNLTNRLGVISFGSEARVDLRLTEAKIDNLKSIRAILEQNLKNQSLGDTHFVSAFKQAVLLYQDLQPDPSRKRMLILITDGAPFPPYFRSNSSSEDITKYLNELKYLIINSFPGPQHEFYVYGLNDDESNYWERYGPFWLELTKDHAVKLDSSNEYDIFDRLQTSINQVLENESEKVPVGAYDNLFIPPYLESVVFHVFSVQPEHGISFYSPDAPDRPLTPNDEGVSFLDFDQTIHTVTVQHPAPGGWKIRKTNKESRVSIYTQKFFTQGILAHPANGQLKQFEKTPVHYQVIKSQGEPIEELPEYPLTLSLKLVKPNGSEANFDMKKDPALGPGMFRTAEDISCDLPGTFQTVITVTTKDPNYNLIEIFTDRQSSFQVKGAKRITGQITSPSQDEDVPVWGQWIFTPRNQPYDLKFFDDAQQPVNLEALLGESIERLVVIRNGDALLSPGEFSIKADGAGTYSGDFFNMRVGNHQLSFAVDQNRAAGNLVVVFDPETLRIRRFLTWFHWLQFIAPSLILAIILALLAWRFWNNWRYPLRGKLLIERLGAQHSWALSLRGDRHQMTFKEKDLPNQVNLKKILVRMRKDKRGGITISAIGNKKTGIVLKNRSLADGGSAVLRNMPYQFKYKLN